MSAYKILVTDGLAEKGLALLSTVGEVTSNPKITAAEVQQVLPEYDALVVRSRTKVTRAVVEAGKKLRVIGRAGVGVDNIDVPAALEHGVTVVNSPLAASVAVAEHTLGMMLALARRIPAADASMKAGKWEKSAFMGSELNGKTLGLIGLGRIGVHVAKLASAFEMRVVAYDPIISAEQIRERGAEPVSLDDLLPQSDYLSLHLPLNDKTRGMLNAQRIASFKPGARLVCTARGGIVDEEALRAALDSDALAGAALDVFASEPVQPGSIAEHPKVIATPHIGAQTKEAQTRAGIAIAEEVLAVLQDKEPRWRVLAND